jgi:hypothetical protein
MPRPWQLGGCTWLPVGGYLASWTEGGFGRLALDGEDFTGDYSRFRIWRWISSSSIASPPRRSARRR